jgi:putative transposase
VDSQSIKTATQGTDVGFAGHKKGKGRKRHILLDMLGLMVAVVVTAANTDDRQGLVELLKRYCASGVTRLRLTASSEAMIQISMIRSLLKRLA